MLNNLEGFGHLARAFLAWLAGAAVGVLVATGLAAAGDGAHDWPNWRGPFCSGSAADCGEELVEDISTAKLLWRSEETIPNSGGQQKNLGCGYDDVIVADGRAYLRTFVPTGKPDERFARMLAKGQFSKRAPELIPDCSKPLADDVVLCWDAHTGKTLWKAVFPEQGANMNHLCYPYGVYAPQLVTCVAEGRVFAFSSSGRIHCLRASDGKPLWEGNLGPAAERVIMRLEDYRRNHEFMGASYDGYGRGLNPFFDLSGEGLAGFDSSAVVAAGVLVTPSFMADHKGKGCGVTGLDATTGAHLWSAPECSFDVASFPVRWRRGGKEYVIAVGAARAVCLEPRTGRVLWEIKGESICAENYPAVSDEYLVTPGRGNYQNTQSQGECVTCYRITPEKAEKVWSAPPQYRHGSFHGPVIYRDKVYWLGGGGATCAELATGKILGVIKLGGGNPALIAGDGRLFCGAGMASADPQGKGDPSSIRTEKNAKVSVGLAEWCSSTIADGRLYYRTSDHVVCFELRRNAKAEAAVNEEPPSSDPKVLCRRLSARDFQTREAALKALSEQASPVLQGLLPDLLGLLKTDDWQAQSAAAAVLTKLGPAAKNTAVDLVELTGAAVTAGEAAKAALLVRVLVAVEPAAVDGLAARIAKHLEDKTAAPVIAACAALREAGPRAAPVASTLAQTFATGDTRVTVAAADALAAIGPGAAAAVDVLLAALADKDDGKALQASRALMGIGSGARSATEKIVDAFCARPGPSRFYLGEVLRAIGPVSIPVLIQRTSAQMPVQSKVRGEQKRGDPALLRDAAKVLKNFGTAAKDATPYLQKVVTAMGTGANSHQGWVQYIEEAIEVVNGRPSKRVVGMGKHGYPCPLGADDGSSKSETPSKKGTDNDEP